MATEEELRRKAKQAIDLGRLNLYASDEAAHQSMDKDLRGNAPSDEELAYQVRQGSNDAAAAEDANRHEAPINKYSVKSAARGALKVISPAASYMLDKAREAENRADLDASMNTGTTNVQGQTGAQVAQGAEDRLNNMETYAQPQGARVIGFTKAGYVPTTRQSQAQVQREQMPDGYWDLVNQEMDQKRIAGESALAQHDALALQAENAGEARRKLSDALMDNAERASQEEDKALLGAQDRINSAIAEFQNSGPKMISYKDIWNQQDAGGKVMMALGFIAGALGGARDQRNTFFEALDANIKRKIDIQEKEAERRGQAIGYAKNAYEVLHQRLRDRDATRKILNAMYLAQFDQQVANQANALGIDYSSGRAADFRAGLLDQYRQLLKDGASKVVESQANAEKYAPATAITVGSNADAQAANEENSKYEEERRKKLLPEKRAGIQMLREGASALGEKGLVGRALIKSYLKNPKSFKSTVMLEGMSKEEREAVNKLSAGLDLLMRQEGGKTLTDSEIARTLSRYVGNGSQSDILKGSDTAQAEVDQLENSLHSQFPRGYPVGNLRRKIYANTEQPHEIKGEEKAADITKDVVSPEAYVPPAKKKKGE